MVNSEALRATLSSSLTADDASDKKGAAAAEMSLEHLESSQKQAAATAGMAKSRMELIMCLLLVLLGCSTCAVAWAMQRAIDYLQYAHRRIEFMDTGYFAADVTAWAGFRVLLVLLAVFATASISPRAAGSGIPEMKCILAGMNLDEHMDRRTVCAKVIGLVLMCGAGMPVGREGPLVHIAGSIALGMLRLPIFRSIASSEVRKHEVLGAACAVGVTAAFGAPLGGVLFSIEATTTYFLTSSYWHSFVCAVTGCVFFRFADAHGGMGTESSEIGSRTEQLISAQFFEIDYAVLPAHVLLGTVCGLLAAAFISIAAFLFRFTRPWSKQHMQLNEHTLTPRTRHVERMMTMKFRKYWYAASVALLGGLAEYSIASRGGVHSDETSGGFMTSGLFKCTYDFMYFEDLSNATGRLPTLTFVDDGGGGATGGNAAAIDAASLVPQVADVCSAGHYGVATPTVQLQATVYNEDWGEYGGVIGSLGIWCVSKLIFASLSLTIFAPAGCLGPCIAIGAGLGRLVGESLAYLNFGCIPAAQLATAGAAAFAGGVTGTVSVAVIVFEMTKQIHFSVPVLISVLTARAVAGLFVESLYDTMLRLGRLPALPNQQSTDRQFLQVRR